MAVEVILANPAYRRRMLTLVGAVSLAALHCAPAITPPVPADAPATAVARLQPADVTALAELLAMEDRRLLEPGRLRELARHSHPLVRGRAALAAGRTGDAGAAELILPLLGDSVAEVRADAAFALGLAGDTSIAVVAALATVARAPTLDAATVEAIAALGRLGSAGAARIVADLLHFEEATTDGAAADLRRAGEAALAAWRLPRTDAIVDALITLAGSPDPEVRWRATYALVRMAPPRAAATLLARLDDQNAFIRSLAARGLRAPLVDSARLAAARPALAARLGDVDPQVRINAARALGSFADADAVPPLTRLLADADSMVVFAATEALVAAGPPAAGTLRAVAADPFARPALRAVALAGLARHAWDHAEPILAEWQQSDDWLLRLYAARALAGAPWEVAGARAAVLARDADPRIAAAGFAAVAGMLPPTTGRAILTEGIAAADPLVRAAALRGIQRSVQPADLSILLEAYAAAQADAQPDAGIAAIDALATLATLNMPVHRAFYARFRPPADPVLRRHAAARITPSPWEVVPIETGRTAVSYEALVRTYIVPRLEGAPPPRAVIESVPGNIVLELDGFHAPITVHNFVTLAESGFFDAGPDARPRWHRVVPNFVLQDGDPRGDGAGGPGFSIRDELNRLRYGRGVLGMALSGPDTGGSQWFITHSPQPHLDAGYTIFGRVVAGMDLADRVLQDDGIRAIRIERGPPLRGSDPP
jgi:cyclophilin family peptidyl-prolyl cis-trans isomerase/HEAT repeat protein